MVQRIQIPSKAVDEEGCYLLAIPKNHVPGTSRHVIVFLHGLMGGPADWLRTPRILERVKAVWGEEGTHTPILVFPRGKNGYWTNWNNRPKRWRDWVTHEVLPDLRRQLGGQELDPESTTVMGLSMGGFGALSIAMEYPGFFQRAIAMSPTDMAIAVQGKNQLRVYRRVFGKDLPTSAIERANPFHMVENGRGEGQSFYLVYGTNEGPKFTEGGRRLTTAMRERGISVRSVEVPGGTHSYKSTWSHAEVENALQWLQKEIESNAEERTQNGASEEKGSPRSQKKTPGEE